MAEAGKKFYSKEEALAEKDFLVSEMRQGKIFIYPTDTVYGLGANAELLLSAEKINGIKKRQGKNFLVIVPSMAWIFAHCECSEKAQDILQDRLPGPFSFRLKMKDKNILADPEGTVGVRIPDHWFASFVSRAGLPFITTSVNLAGQPPLLKIKDLDEEIIEKVDYIIQDDGSLSGKPSTLIDLTADEEKIIRP